jgi:hypothetical protein
MEILPGGGVGKLKFFIKGLAFIKNAVEYPTALLWG